MEKDAKVNAMVDNAVASIQFHEKENRNQQEIIRLLPEIKKVSELVAKDEFSLEASIFCSGFVQGSKWRIKSVWHSNTEMSDRNLDKYYQGEECLIETLKGNIYLGTAYYGYGYNGKMWYTITCHHHTFTMDEIKRWAYVKDLMFVEEQL